MKARQNATPVSMDAHGVTEDGFGVLMNQHSNHPTMNITAMTTATATYACEPGVVYICDLEHVDIGLTSTNRQSSLAL